MNNLELEQKIISLIPSQTIKDGVKNTSHRFSELELVQLIIEFAPTWDGMLEMLLEIKKYITDDKTIKYITEYIKIEKK